jgi:hypothetical protein
MELGAIYIAAMRDPANQDLLRGVVHSIDDPLVANDSRYPVTSLRPAGGRFERNERFN